jgi:hypothetical protein
MIPKTRALSSKPNLVRAYETLREAILSSGDGATVPVDAWRLVQEGLLSWGLCDAAAQCDASVCEWTLDVAADSHDAPSGQARAEAAVVKLMATMTLRSMTPVEGTS